MPGVRQPAVAGQFYESRKEALVAAIERCFLHPLGPGALPVADPDGPGSISAVVSPHAGYMYSGPAAAHGYRALAEDGIPETVVILGPSHYTSNRRAAVSLVNAWRTPLGDASVDTSFGQQLIAASSLFEEDEQTHRDEHSLEVQVPFLQFGYRGRMPMILPICLRSHPMGSIEALIADARAIGETIARTAGARRVAVIASTDLSHQVPQEMAQRQDRLALEAIEAVDPAGLLSTVSRHRVSMCGPVPVAVALFACRMWGEHKAKVLAYYTSGDIIGERRAVVGYASAVLRRGEGDVR